MKTIKIEKFEDYHRVVRFKDDAILYANKSIENCINKVVNDYYLPNITLMLN